MAGVVIVAIIAASSALAGYTAIMRLARPQHVADLVAVAGAALAGFAGNGLAAWYRIRTGRRIGSAALVADGLRARADGLTSLVVLAGAAGTAAGWTGHQIRAECEVIVDPVTTAAEAHEIAAGAEHAPLHAIPRPSAVLAHADPEARGTEPHRVLAGHRPDHRG